MLTNLGTENWIESYYRCQNPGVTIHEVCMSVIIYMVGLSILVHCYHFLFKVLSRDVAVDE